MGEESKGRLDMGCGVVVAFSQYCNHADNIDYSKARNSREDNTSWPLHVRHGG